MKLFSMTMLMLAVISSMALAQISSTAHDFSGSTWSGGEICVPCHTPHNADVSVTNAPLWNHALTIQSYTLYTGYRMNATVAQPGGISKLCLSCHDGTVALDSFGGSTGTTMIGSGNANLGATLADDHPIGFTYDATLATNDGELYDPTTATSGLGSTIHNDLLASGSLECSSCHDVHDDTNSPFLVKSNASSALCLTCHNK
jgi:predicted CXXCH cytochrome family protein